VTLESDRSAASKKLSSRVVTIDFVCILARLIFRVHNTLSGVRVRPAGG